MVWSQPQNLVQGWKAFCSTRTVHAPVEAVLHVFDLKPHKYCQLSSSALKFWAASLLFISLVSHPCFNSSWLFCQHIYLFQSYFTSNIFIFISQCLWTLPLFSTVWVSTLEMSQLLQVWLLHYLVCGCSRPHRTLSFTSVRDQLRHYLQTTSLGPNSTQICPSCFLRWPQPCLRLSHVICLFLSLFLLFLIVEYFVSCIPPGTKCIPWKLF